MYAEADDGSEAEDLPDVSPINSPINSPVRTMSQGSIAPDHAHSEEQYGSAMEPHLERQMTPAATNGDTPRSSRSEASGMVMDMEQYHNRKRKRLLEPTGDKHSSASPSSSSSSLASPASSPSASTAHHHSLSSNNSRGHDQAANKSAGTAPPAKRGKSVSSSAALTSPHTSSLPSRPPTTWPPPPGRNNNGRPTVPTPKISPSSSPSPQAKPPTIASATAVPLAALDTQVPEPVEEVEEADDDQPHDDPELTAALTELLNTPMFTTPQHLMCPLTLKAMNDPVVTAGDGYTYERAAIQAWIQQRLPADRASDDVPVPGPQGDPVSLAGLIPSRTTRDAVARWRRRRKALKKTIRQGRSEPVAARRLRRCLRDVRARELGHFEKAQRLSQIEDELLRAHDQAELLGRAAGEKAALIARQEANLAEHDARVVEAEEQLRALVRRLEELRASQEAERQRLEALQHEALSIQQETTALHQESNALQQSGAALMREREETKVDLDRAWEEIQACIAQLEEARKLSVDLQQVVDEHPGTRSLRDKLEESNQDLHRLHHEINQLQNTIATELCSRARMMDTEDPYRAEMLLRACNLGSTEAQYKLGKYYLIHEGEERAKALGYFMHVVESGLDETGRVRSGLSVQEGALVSKALYNVGCCQRRGVGTPVDCALAYHYFAMAADSGHAAAQNMMGDAYNEVGGVFPRDVEMAFKYFEKSSAQGDKMATYNLAILYQSDEIKARDDRHAFNLFKSLAEGGDEDSMHEVSQCYREGKGVARDMEKAEYWLRKRQTALAENGGSAKAD
ncbi:Sel1 repeat and Ubox domain containing protein [Acanthamoeba castellanii str. Neff]|uniref:Sel1 repeat and Ubox domain containing protein n=1 Tax=Acanthamoeba castellanii (strain ATCC 30010 / Neff) TaxID=1257118 RepID=L8GZF7_ACACF|nr:Sel1 repeat and Ubox domain containing protein [Acanthamoeba castellanii str. Neff]ELR17491.1 Sel1 repeat and Ubox domain containing protein [Acanthamoeba castellanii str. Neff]